MIPRFIATLILSVFGLIAFGQTSLNERNGFWTTGSNWSGGTMPGTLSGGTVTVVGKVIGIHGTVKSLDNITATLSNVTITANDTLVIMGNLNLTSSSFTNNGVLIVFGNVSNTGSNAVVSGAGKMVVTGNYTNALGANTLTGPSYVFGSTPGFFPPTGDSNSIQTNDPGLYNYQQNIFNVLPIELSYFRATPENNQVRLTWETLSESGNDYFLVERSANGFDFDLVQRVAGAGNSHSTLKYKISDVDPLPGRSYYKLSQTDFDGRTSAFKIVSVVNDREAFLQIYPNPVTDFLYFNCSVCLDAVTIRSASDRLPGREIPLARFENGKSGIDVTHLDPGVYFVIVTRVGSASPATYRIIKK